MPPSHSRRAAYAQCHVVLGSWPRLAMVKDTAYTLHRHCMHYFMHYCAVGRALPCLSRRRHRAESWPCPAPSRRQITRGPVGGSLYGAECGARVRSSTGQNHKRATRRATAVAITPRRLARRGAPRRVVLVSGRGLQAGRAGGSRVPAPPTRRQFHLQSPAPATPLPAQGDSARSKNRGLYSTQVAVSRNDLK